MKHLKSKWTILVAILAAVAVLAAFSFGRNSGPQYFTAKAEQGDIHDVVEATGTINAVNTVQVGSQVSGTISKLYTDFNSRVKRGEVLAQLDPSLFAGAVLQAKADLANAQANSASAEANLAKAKAAIEQTAADYARSVALTNEGVISRQQLDASKAANDSAKAAVNAAEAQVTQAEAQVAQKKAALDVAQTNLDHTIIRAPVDGTVVARNIDVGQTVAASLQAPVLFNIAEDLTKMYVYTATDESDVGQMKVGQPATFTVDAFPRDTFRGRVIQVRMNPTTVQNVVTYQTVIEFNNPDLKLFPGMTAYVAIPVADATRVLRIPNGALRYTPDLKPDQLKALLEQNGISGGGKGRAAQAKTPAANAPAASGAPHEKPLDIGLVWKLTADKKLVPVQLKTGITDHTFTQVAQVLHGSLNPGEELVVGAASASKPAGGGMAGGPGMGGR
jgi:HlyD family secretion protein